MRRDAVEGEEGGEVDDSPALLAVVAHLRERASGSEHKRSSLLHMLLEQLHKLAPRPRLDFMAPHHGRQPQLPLQLLLSNKPVLVPIVLAVNEVGSPTNGFAQLGEQEEVLGRDVSPREEHHVLVASLRGRQRRADAHLVRQRVLDQAALPPELRSHADPLPGSRSVGEVDEEAQLEQVLPLQPRDAVPVRLDNPRTLLGHLLLPLCRQVAGVDDGVEPVGGDSQDELEGVGIYRTRGQLVLELEQEAVALVRLYHDWSRHSGLVLVGLDPDRDVQHQRVAPVHVDVVLQVLRDPQEGNRLHDPAQLEVALSLRQPAPLPWPAQHVSGGSSSRDRRSGNIQEGSWSTSTSTRMRMRSRGTREEVTRGTPREVSTRGLP
eukprot:768722-Hanusia_phi.AAC.2